MSETVRVRVAVAVDSNGEWNACGAVGMDDQDAMCLAADPLEFGEARYWLEAKLPLPQP